MYFNQVQMTIEDFSTPLPLDPDNRWVRWADMIPWKKLNKSYSALFKKNGHPAYNVRVAVGSLLVKQLLNLSDEGTVQAISESHYLQFFIGLPSFTLHCPFDASTLTRFRKRLTDTAILRTANDYLIQNADHSKKEEANNKDDDPPPNDGPKGTMIVDATCAPSDIAFPTDVRLLHVTRVHLEKLIDDLWDSSWGKKPRTRRRQARKAYLRFARNRKPSPKKVRQAVRQQLGYVRRDLAFIRQIMDKGTHLSEKQEQITNTAQLIYEQQNEMYLTKKHRVDHRIVSFDQPYVRPIQRGKAKAATEFGPKFEITVIDGYTKLSKLSWENYNESQFLIEKIEAYHQLYDHYPARVLTDKIYATRANRQFCKAKGIHLQGPPLGRPRKFDDPDKKIQYQDSCERNQVESKFGTLKTFHGLERLRSRLKDTSELEIELAILGLNLCKRARSSFVVLCKSLFFAFKIHINVPKVTLIMR